MTPSFSVLGCNVKLCLLAASSDEDRHHVCQNLGWTLIIGGLDMYCHTTQLMPKDVYDPSTLGMNQ